MTRKSGGCSLQPSFSLPPLYLPLIIRTRPTKPRSLISCAKPAGVSHIALHAHLIACVRSRTTHFLFKTDVADPSVQQMKLLELVDLAQHMHCKRSSITFIKCPPCQALPGTGKQRNSSVLKFSFSSPGSLPIHPQRCHALTAKGRDHAIGTE